MPVRASVDELSDSDNEVVMPVRGSKPRAMKVMKVMKFVAKKRLVWLCFCRAIDVHCIFGYHEGHESHEGDEGCDEEKGWSDCVLQGD